MIMFCLCHLGLVQGSQSFPFQDLNRYNLKTHQYILKCKYVLKIHILVY